MAAGACIVISSPNGHKDPYYLSELLSTGIRGVPIVGMFLFYMRFHSELQLLVVFSILQGKYKSKRLNYFLYFPLPDKTPISVKTVKWLPGIYGDTQNSHMKLTFLFFNLMFEKFFLEHSNNLLSTQTLKILYL